MARDRRSLLEAWRVFFAHTEHVRKEDEDAREQVTQALTEAKKILDRTADEAREAPSLAKTTLDAANVRAAEVPRREEVLLFGESALCQREHDVDARERAAAELEADAKVREAEAEKTASDLRSERTKPEQLQEALDAQHTKLDHRQTALANREVTHQQNVEKVDARLKERHDKMEASNRNTLAEDLAKQQQDARADYKKKLDTQEAHFKEKSKALEAQCI